MLCAVRPFAVPVGIVAGEHDEVVAEHVDDARQDRLLRLAGRPDVARPQVLGRIALPPALDPAAAASAFLDCRNGRTGRYRSRRRYIALCMSARADRAKSMSSSPIRSPRSSMAPMTVNRGPSGPRPACGVRVPPPEAGRGTSPSPSRPSSPWRQPGGAPQVRDCGRHHRRHRRRAGASRLLPGPLSLRLRLPAAGAFRLRALLPLLT